MIGYDDKLSGETLYISAPLARLFTKQEMTAVICHELGHFRGADIQYSLKFAPVYSGLGRAITAVDTNEDDGLSAIAKLPAMAILSFMFEIFSIAERSVGRDRELEADRAVVEVSSPKALAISLAKVSLYAGMWDAIRNENIERLNDGKVAGNLCKVFEDIAKFDVERKSIDEILEQVLDNSIAHPTDTHPTVSQRLDALGLESSEIDKDGLGVPQDSAISLIDNVIEVEKELTLLEHRLMVFEVAKDNLKILEEDMSPSQLESAQKFSREWREKNQK